MENCIRVLHVLDGLNIGGMEVFVMNYYRKINKENIQFDFVIFEEDRQFYVNEILNLGGNVHCLNYEHSNNKYINLYRKVMKLTHFLKEHPEYTIVHSHGCSFLGILQGTISAKLKGIKSIIGHAHSASIEGSGIAERTARSFFKSLTYWSCNHYFACSEDSAKTKYPSTVFTNNKVVYLHNAIDTSIYKFNEETRKNMREKLNLKNSTLTLGIIGRLEIEKNHTFLLDVFHELQQLNKDVALLIVGSGSLEAELKNKTASLGLNNVIYTGSVNNPYNYYQAMDCFLLPSLYEGIPFVLIEAQAAGLPCVISSNINKDTCILPSTVQLSITEDPKSWAIYLSNIKTIDRAQAYEEIVRIGYDLTGASNDLMNMYIQFDKSER